MPLAAIRKQRICWSPCAENSSSSTKSKGVVVRRIGLNSGPYCDRIEGLYLSRPQTWRDEVCSFFIRQVVRCHSCMLRHYRPLFLPPVPVWRETKVVDNIANEEERQRQ